MKVRDKYESEVDDGEPAVPYVSGVLRVHPRTLLQIRKVGKKLDGPILLLALLLSRAIAGYVCGVTA